MNNTNDKNVKNNTYKSSSGLSFSSSSKAMTEEQEKELAQAKKSELFTAINKMKSSGNVSMDMSRRSNASPFKYTPEQIERFTHNPSAFQKELRHLSNYLYDYSAEYRIIIDYMSNLGTYTYVLESLSFLDETTDYKMFEKSKLKASAQLNKMNLPHEMAKAMKKAWKHDVFYGYEHETKDSYYIQHMNEEYCKLSSVDFDGVFLYSFDFSYFDGEPELLESYPLEFKEKYQTYQRTLERWQELDSEKAFAFKVNEEITQYPLLPYSILFDPIFELEEYKKIQKAKTKMDNFMLLVQKIPINDKSQSMDDFLISLETAMEFHTAAVAGLGDNPGIGFVTSPMDIDSIRTDKGGKSDKDSVATALRTVYDAGGISQFLVNSDKSTSTGVAKSIIVDEQKIYKMNRQIERWLNRKIRGLSGRFKFKARLLDITSFDEGEAFDLFLKGAQSGFPSIEESAASLGISYQELHNKLVIENSPISLQERMKPLQTSHTQSGKDDNKEVGRKTLGDDKVSDSTVVNRDAGTDENKANK